jgi:hypothetical protein
MLLQVRSTHQLLPQPPQLSLLSSWKRHDYESEQQLSACTKQWHARFSLHIWNTGSKAWHLTSVLSLDNAPSNCI